MSFDDGDHWQSLQLNLPVTSVRDFAIHGDDLISCHPRPLLLDSRQHHAAASGCPRSGRRVPFWLYHPAEAYRIDNDSFVGTPLPPEEPTAENPPRGAMIDYFLRSPARNIHAGSFRRATEDCAEILVAGSEFASGTPGKTSIASDR